MTGIRIFLVDGSYYDAFLEKEWNVIMHELIVNGAFGTTDFFCNRASVLKVVRLDPAQLGVQAPPSTQPPPMPPGSVLRPQFSVIRGLGGDPNALPTDQDNQLRSAPNDLDADDVVARVEEGARVLYAQAGHFSPWDKADPGVKDHFRDQAARRIAPLAEDPPPAS
jgi:hypothetical protein